MERNEGSARSKVNATGRPYGAALYSPKPMPKQTVVITARIEIEVEWTEPNGEDGFPLTGSQQMEAFRIAQAAENVRRLKIAANTAHARAKADFIAVPWGPKPFA